MNIYDDSFKTYDLGGYWFYFGMKMAEGDKEWINEFVSEIEKLIINEAIEEGMMPSGKNDKKQKGISVRRMRR